SRGLAGRGLVDPDLGGREVRAECRAYVVDGGERAGTYAPPQDVGGELQAYLRRARPGQQTDVGLDEPPHPAVEGRPAGWRDPGRVEQPPAGSEGFGELGQQPALV